MKKLMLAAVVSLFLVSLVSPVLAASQTDEAKALVEKAAAFVKANGKEKAFAEFNNPKGQFVKGELYIFVWDLNGIILAHGANSKLWGKDVSEFKDADGKLFVKEGLQLAKSKGSGWVDYKWSNPVNKKVEAKTTYVHKVDDMIICCGAYK